MLLVQVRKALCVLLQHNLATYQLQKRGCVEYEAERRRVLRILRYPRYIYTAKALYGDTGELLVEELLLNGKMTLSAVVRKVADRLTETMEGGRPPPGAAAPRVGMFWGGGWEAAALWWGLGGWEEGGGGGVGGVFAQHRGLGDLFSCFLVALYEPKPVAVGGLCCSFPALRCAQESDFAPRSPSRAVPVAPGLTLGFCLVVNNNRGDRGRAGTEGRSALWKGGGEMAALVALVAPIPAAV